MKKYKYNSNGNVLSITDDGALITPSKTVYATGEFIALLKNKLLVLKVAAETNEDIALFLFNVPMMLEVNLNNLPEWFMDAVAAMVTENIYTQNQVDLFLER